MMSNNPKKKQQMEKKQYEKPDTKGLIMEDLLDGPQFGKNVSHPKDHEVHSKENSWDEEDENDTNLWERY